jgi:hypothetical protein
MFEELLAKRHMTLDEFDWLVREILLHEGR